MVDGGYKQRPTDTASYTRHLKAEKSWVLSPLGGSSRAYDAKIAQHGVRVRSM
jgi:hypothetical protein